MKKLFCLTFIVCFSFVFLAGCTSKPSDNTETDSDKSSKAVSINQTEKEETLLLGLRNSIRENNCMLGVAFIGYVNSEGTEEDVHDYLANSACAKAYPFLTDYDAVLHEGAELYAFVPANEEYQITVYGAGVTENGEYEDYKETPICQGKPGEIIVLRCNLSEIYSNVLVCVTDGDAMLEYRPMLSMMDGRLAQAEACYDFTVYDSDGQQNEDTHPAYVLLLENDEIKYYINKGMVLTYTGDTQTIDGHQCIVFALATEHEDKLVRERYYAVFENTIYSFDSQKNEWSVLGKG